MSNCWLCMHLLLIAYYTVSTVGLSCGILHCTSYKTDLQVYSERKTLAFSNGIAYQARLPLIFTRVKGRKSPGDTCRCAYVCKLLCVVLEQCYSTFKVSLGHR